MRGEQRAVGPAYAEGPAVADEQTSAARSESSRWDLLAEELQRLRVDVGEPSYAAVAQLVMDGRVAAGRSPHSARIARSTVYDCFRTGRVRVNLALVREIAEVLGADGGQVDEWISRCRQGQTHGPGTEAGTQGDDPAVDARPPAEPTGRTILPPPPGRRAVLLVVVGAVALNLAGRGFQEVLHLPIYLDMTGTAIAAMALGPWWGALVGGLTNSLAVATSGPASLPFGLVNVAGALVWGYGVRRLGFGRTLPRFFTLNLLVAVVSSLIAVPILLLLFAGSTGHGQDGIGATILELTGSTGVAVAASNLLVSVGDKMLSGFVALVAIAALPLSLRSRTPLDVLPPTPAHP